jgi:hypothetical protein
MVDHDSDDFFVQADIDSSSVDFHPVVVSEPAQQYIVHDDKLPGNYDRFVKKLLPKFQDSVRFMIPHISELIQAEYDADVVAVRAQLDQEFQPRRLALATDYTLELQRRVAAIPRPSHEDISRALVACMSNGLNKA